MLYKTLFTVLGLAVALVTGCSSNEEQKDLPQKLTTENQISLMAHTKEKRVHTKDLTVEKTANIQIGAAINEGSYEHVLANGQLTSSPLLSNNVRYDRKKMFNINDTLSSINKIQADILSNRNKDHRNDLSTALELQKNSFKDWDKVLLSSKDATDYSVYELSRWERFCNFGINMDKRDWQFVKSHQEAFPSELKDTCHLPSYALLKKHQLIKQ